MADHRARAEKVLAEWKRTGEHYLGNAMGLLRNRIAAALREAAEEAERGAKDELTAWTMTCRCDEYEATLIVADRIVKKFRAWGTSKKARELFAEYDAIRARGGEGA